MADKVIDSVVENALALKKIAIESAKTELMNELSPKIKKLFDEKVNKASDKVLSEQEGAPEEDVSVSVEASEDEKAEVDLDDLAKEIEKEEGTDGEEKSVEDKVDDLAQKLDAVEDKVEDVKSDVAELKGEDEGEEEAEEKEAENKEEAAPKEDDEAKEESDDELELGEAVDISIKDKNVRIDVDSGDSEYVDIIDDTESYSQSEPAYEEENEDIEIEDDSEDEDIKEHRKMIRNKIREQAMEDKEGHLDPEDGEFVEIEDDTQWHEGEAEKKVHLLPAGKAEKLVPKLENRIRILKSALKKAADTIVAERKEMNRVRDILSETKLLNEKLVLVNRIFAKYDLNQNRKYKVLEAFDKAETAKESFVVYKTILEHFDAKKTPLKESAKVEKKEVNGTKKTEALTEAVKKGVKEPEATGVLTEAKSIETARILKLAGVDPSAE